MTHMCCSQYFLPDFMDVDPHNPQRGEPLNPHDVSMQSVNPHVPTGRVANSSATALDVAA